MASVLTREHGGELHTEPGDVETGDVEIDDVETGDVVIIDDVVAPRHRSRLAIAVLVVLLAEAVARVVGPLGPTPIEWRDRIVQHKVEQMDARGTTDVVLAGTSMVMQGLDPAGLDVDAYNAAIDAAVPAIQQDWLVERVVPRLDPSMVIWGVAPMDLNDSADHPWVRSYHAAPAVRDGFFGTLERLGRDRSALIRYRTEFREPGEFLEGLGTGEDWRPAEITEDGFRARFDQSPTEAHRADTASFFTDYGASTADTDLVASVVGSLEARGIDVVIAILPIPDRTVALLPNGADDLVEFEQRLRETAGAAGAEVVDLRAGLTDDRYYTDYAHLTEEGAVELTRALNNALASIR